jgi:GxxExxY protein
MTENEIAHEIVDAAYRIHVALGPGLLESVYRRILAHELKKRGLAIEQERPIPIEWDQEIVDIGYRADIVVEDKVIVETKAIDKILPIHRRQTQTHINLADKRLGLLINFGEYHIKDGIHRIVNNLQEL